MVIQKGIVCMMNEMHCVNVAGQRNLLDEIVGTFQFPCVVNVASLFFTSEYEALVILTDSKINYVLIFL